MTLQCDRQFLPNGTITITARLILPPIRGLNEAIERFHFSPSLVVNANHITPPQEIYTPIEIYPNVSYLMLRLL